MGEGDFGAEVDPNMQPSFSLPDMYGQTGGYDMLGGTTGQVDTGESGNGQLRTNSAPSDNMDFSRLLKTAGYVNNTPSTNETGDSGGGDGGQSGRALQSWLTQNGYSIGIHNTEGGSYTNIFNKSGNKIGGQDQYSAPEDDSAFGLALALAAGAAGGYAGGAFTSSAGADAGLAGAASDAGSLGAGATGATTATVGSSAPGWAVAAGQGAGSGIGSSLATNGPSGQALKSGLVGGVTGGLTSGFDPAGYAGVTDPTYARPINQIVGGGINGGVRAGAGGQNILNGITSGATSAGIGAGFHAGGDFINNNVLNGYDPNYSHEGNNYTAPGGDGGGGMGDDSNGGYGGGGQASDFQSWLNNNSQSSPAAMPSGGNYFGQQNTDYSPASTAGGYSGNGYSPGLSFSAPQNQQGSQQQQGQPQQQQDGNPIKALATGVGNYMSGLNGGKGANYGDMASGLMGMYSAYQQRKNQGQLAGGLQDMYSPNSAYAQQMGHALSARDAASGRRSQYGSRQVELQAALAAGNSRNAPMLSQIYGSQNAGLNGMLNNGLNLGRQFGLPGLMSSYMQHPFTSASNSGYQGDPDFYNNPPG